MIQSYPSQTEEETGESESIHPNSDMQILIFWTSFE